MSQLDVAALYADLIYNETEDGLNTAIRVGTYAKAVVSCLNSFSKRLGVIFDTYQIITSIDDLPDEPTDAQKKTAFILDGAIYIYVGTGGDTKDGLYQKLELSGKDYTVNQDQELLIVTADDETQYACHVDKYEAPDTPTITIPGADTDATRTANFSCATSGATLQYKIGEDGDWATATSYTLVASTSSKTTSVDISVRAVKNGLVSAIATATLVASRHLTAPTITADNDEYSFEGRNITLAQSQGATLYYTLDSSTPTTSSTKYTGAFNIASTKTIKVLAVLTDWENATSEKKVDAGILPMWWGLIDASASTPSTDAAVKALGNEIKETSFPQSTTKITDTTQKRVVIAYPKTYGNLVTVLDENDFEYITSFPSTPVTTENYKVYAMIGTTDHSAKTYRFSDTEIK